MWGLRLVIVIETEGHGVGAAEIVAHHVGEQLFDHEVDAEGGSGVELVVVRESLHRCGATRVSPVVAKPFPCFPKLLLSVTRAQEMCSQADRW